MEPLNVVFLVILTFCLAFCALNAKRKEIKPEYVEKNHRVQQPGQYLFYHGQEESEEDFITKMNEDEIQNFNEPVAEYVEKDWNPNLEYSGPKCRGLGTPGCPLDPWTLQCVFRQKPPFKPASFMHYSGRESVK